MVLMKIDDGTDLEHKLSNGAFLHGRSYESDINSDLVPTNGNLWKDLTLTFDGFSLDTVFNRRSVMSKSQYLAYRNEIWVTLTVANFIQKSIYRDHRTMDINMGDKDTNNIARR